MTAHSSIANKFKGNKSRTNEISSLIISNSQKALERSNLKNSIDGLEDINFPPSAYHLD